jgi:hypothetical protein
VTGTGTGDGQAHDDGEHHRVQRQRRAQDAAHAGFSRFSSTHHAGMRM